MLGLEVDEALLVIEQRPVTPSQTIKMLVSPQSCHSRPVEADVSPDEAPDTAIVGATATAPPPSSGGVWIATGKGTTIAVGQELTLLGGSLSGFMLW